MICPYCKKLISDNSVFCSECGQSIKKREGDEGKTIKDFWENVKIDEESLATTKSYNKLLFVISIIIVIIIIVVIIGIGSKNKSNMDNSDIVDSQNKEENIEDDDVQSDIDELEEEQTIENTDSDETKTSEIYIDTESPFNQDYWVIFTEAYRSDRVEAASIDSSIVGDELYLIWDTSLELNNTSGSGECDQYYLNANNQWEQIGSYSRLTDGASNVIASNLNIYDENGNLVISGCSYSDLDWNLVNMYR